MCSTLCTSILVPAYSRPHAQLPYPFAQDALRQRNALVGHEFVAIPSGFLQHHDLCWQRKRSKCYVRSPYYAHKHVKS